MKVAIRYLRNLGNFRRQGSVSPSSRDKHEINFKPKLFQEGLFFGKYADGEESFSPVSPRKTSVSPFSLSGDKQLLATLAYPNTQTNTRDLSLIELWNSESPVSLNEEERTYIDFTKEFRRYDEDKFFAFQKRCQEEREQR